MPIRIGLGLTTFPFSGTRAFWRFVDRCEASEVDSLWQSDRLVSSQPYLETMSVMAALAGATDRLKFGMNVAVVSLRDPLVLAKECATIDVLSDGRLLPAFGVGPDIAPEWKAMGHSPAGRGARADEALELMSRLWSEERVTFDAKAILARLAEYTEAGASKFVLRPIAVGDDDWMAQTERLIAEVLPAVHRR